MIVLKKVKNRRSESYVSNFWKFNTRKKLLIIKKLIDKNMSVEEISDIVDLSVEVIQKLLNK